jgi:hypothetical protein
MSRAFTLYVYWVLGDSPVSVYVVLLCQLLSFPPPAVQSKYYWTPLVSVAVVATIEIEELLTA